ncbi:TIGR02452 family protein [Hymenobacter sp. BT186]|uniref:TIGR02452 family protein n=1 Tax=Hymenobacter telluris TaxID=2816474 RepID=A0A939EV98_9BACT|nr:TIGR02452 family protein [Hymenobacter telluris]MBO0358155.1 TIGR02452 family protein [Hymenobacter telluris]MBW3374182.1 TIGR02452 family protein [Hymenobacter norwichensis]
MNRQQIARETLAALQQGSYSNSAGAHQALTALQQAAEQGSVLYRPADVPQLLQVPETPAGPPAEIRVYQATTLEAVTKLAAEFERVGCLNFASARNPGGGFLSGSQAQEESLARSSGLYPCLVQFQEMYSHNTRTARTGLYSDYAIYSPGVPVFRDDAGNWLPQPVLVDFVTSPAVNAGALNRNNPELLPELVPTMQRRIRQVLAIAATHKCDVLVLGAWGCGVFQNDPQQIANLFAEALAEPGSRGRFRRIDFAIFDPKPPHKTLSAFEKALTAAPRIAL